MIRPRNLLRMSFSRDRNDKREHAVTDVCNSCYDSKPKRDPSNKPQLLGKDKTNHCYASKHSDNPINVCNVTIVSSPLMAIIKFSSHVNQSFLGQLLGASGIAPRLTINYQYQPSSSGSSSRAIAYSTQGTTNEKMSTHIGQLFMISHNLP
jgi:hypothetical protein